MHKLVNADAATALSSLAALAYQTAKNQKEADELRLASIQAFGFDDSVRQLELDVLIQLLSPQSSHSLQAEAIKTLGQLGDVKAATKVFERWKSLTPALRDVTLSVAFDKSAWLEMLLTRMEAEQILPQQVSVRYRQRLLNHDDELVHRRVARLLAPVESDRSVVLRRYSEFDAHEPDLAAGREVFKKQCSACHRLEGEGRPVGPDLAAISDKSKAAMLVAILDPNRAVEDKYLAYTVLTHAGETRQGLLFEESATAITLAAPDGESHVVLRNQIEQLSATGKSLMPDGLEQVMTPQDVANVIVYVQSISQPRKRFPDNEPRVAPVRNDGSIRLFAIHAEIFGETLVLEPKYRNLGFWQSRDDRATWTIDAPSAGEYALHIDYACAPQPSPNRFQIRVNGERIGGEVNPTGSWDNYVTRRVDTVRLPETPVRLTFESDGPIDGFLIDLRTILLYPK